MILKEDLQQVLDGIKTPEQRSETWKTLILSLAAEEESLLQAAINDAPDLDKITDEIASSSLEIYDFKKEAFLKASYGFTDKLKALIERLEKPSKAYPSYQEQVKFFQRMREERFKFHDGMVNNVREMVGKYVSGFKAGMDKEKYISDTVSMISIILFQPPGTYWPEHWKRKAMDRAYYDYKPYDYVVKFGVDFKKEMSNLS